MSHNKRDEKGNCRHSPRRCQSYAPSELKARRLSVDGGKTEDDEVGGEDGGRGRLPHFLKDGRATQRGGKSRGGGAAPTTAESGQKAS